MCKSSELAKLKEKYASLKKDYDRLRLRAGDLPEIGTFFTCLKADCRARGFQAAIHGFGVRVDMAPCPIPITIRGTKVTH